MPTRTLTPRRLEGLSKGHQQHLQTLLRRAAKLGPVGEKFIDRMRSCRTGRRCGLHSCPDCLSENRREKTEEALTALDGVAKDDIRFVTILFPPRARLYSKTEDPRKDMTAFKKFLRTTLDNNDIGQVTTLGRFEIDLKLPRSTGYLERFDVAPVGKYLVVPHVHFASALKGDDGFLDTEQTKALFNKKFSHHPRQVWVESLWTSQTKETAVEKVMNYSFKGFTRGLAGHHLLDYLEMQTQVRKDLLTIDYRVGD